MPSLEILNSKFTSKAGKWAMLFYARDQNAKELNEIRKLDLSAKGILHLSDLSVFDQMTSLTSLNISDHPEFLISDEEMEKIQKE